MPLCGLHWYSSYSISIFPFTFIDFECFSMVIVSACSQNVLNKFKFWIFLLLLSAIGYSINNCLYNYCSLQTGLIFVILVILNIHKWNGLDWFIQSYPWHWCMFSSHIFSKSLQLYVVDCGGYHLYIVFNLGDSQLCSELKLMIETINKSNWAKVAFILLSNNSPGPRTSAETCEYPVTNATTNGTTIQLM